MAINEVRIYKSLEDCIKKQPSSVISSEVLSKELWAKKPPYNGYRKKRKQLNTNNNHLFIPQA